MSVITTKQKVHQGLRIALCGSMGAGKTYAANQLKIITDGHIISIAKPIKEIVSSMDLKGRTSHIMVGMVGRQCDSEVWINKCIESIEAYEAAGKDNIIVDDVRFENEARALKEIGFTIIYLDTPWYIRFQRTREREEDLNVHAKWFAHESEIAPALIDKGVFDYICQTTEKTEEVIKSITQSDKNIL